MDVRNSSGKLVSLLNRSESRHVPRSPNAHRVHPYEQQQQSPAQLPHPHRHPPHQAQHQHQLPHLHQHQPQRLRHTASHSPASSISSRSSLSSSSSNANSSPPQTHSHTLTNTNTHAHPSSFSPSLTLPLQLPLPDLSLSGSPRASRTAHNTPSLTRTESSDTCTTHSPSPINTPADQLDPFTFHPPSAAAAAADGLHSVHLASSHPTLSKSHAVVAQHPVLVAPLPSSPTSSTSPPAYYHRRLPLHSAYSYGSAPLSASSAPMDPFDHAVQTASASMQVQMPVGDMQFTAQPYFTKADLQSPAFDPQAFQQAASSPKAKTSQKKNSYPCPVAKQYGCNEFFTTSGHAARHAKKHTGKKDAICPECSKAFTRKDNMEQHRRTHSGVRVAPKTTSSSDESRTKRLKVEKQEKQNMAHETPIPAGPAASTNGPVNIAPVATMEMGMLLDPRLMDSGFNPADPSGILPTSFQQPLPNLSGGPRPSLHRSSYQDAQQTTPGMPNSSSGATPSSASNSPELPSPSVAPALDALALAASRR